MGFTLVCVNIEKAELADFNKIVALHKAHLLEEGAPPNEYQLTHLKATSFSDKEARFVVLAAKRKDEIIAYSIYSYVYSSLLDDSILYIADLFVEPEYRKQGVATKIFKHIQETEDPSALTWKALKTNQNSIAIYKNSGAVVDFENNLQVSFSLQLKPLPDWLCRSNVSNLECKRPGEKRKSADSRTIDEAKLLLYNFDPTKRERIRQAQEYKCSHKPTSRTCPEKIVMPRIKGGKSTKL